MKHQTTDRNYVLRAHIAPDPEQPRKHFDKDKLQELADSFGGKAEGIHTDLLVRPDPKKEGRFILVAGERRWRAAELVKIERLPVRVVSESEAAQALKLQLTENMQRENMTALEEAAGAQKLLAERRQKEPKFSVEQLGGELGKSRASIYELLSLLKLSAPVLKALKGGEITPSHATRIATVPTVEGQKEVLEEIVDRSSWQGTASVRDVEEVIQRDHCKSLKGAPFNLKKVYIPRMTSGKDMKVCACEDCSLRSGNMPNWPDGKNKDLCTLPACFRAKALAAAVEEGKPTVSAEEYLKGGFIKPDDWSHYGTAGYYRASEACGKHAPKKITTVDQRGEVIEVWRRSEWKAACEKNGVKWYKDGHVQDPKAKAALAKEEAATALRENVVAKLVPLLLDKVEAIGKASADNSAKQLSLLRWVFAVLDENYFYDAKTTKSAAKLPLGPAWRLMVQLMLEEQATRGRCRGEYPHEFKLLCELCAVDVKKTEAELGKQDPAALVNYDTLHWLTGTPATDANFKANLERASVATLQEALKSKRGLTATAYSAIQGRLKALSKAAKPEPAKQTKPTKKVKGGKKK